MASSAPFDVHKLFRPPTPSPGPINTSPSPSPTSAGGGFPPASSSPFSGPPQPSPHGAFSYPPPTPPVHHTPFIHYPQDPLHRPPISYPAAPPPHLPNLQNAPGNSPNANPNPNPGARLMALLGATAPSLESAVSMPPPPPPSSSAPPIIHATPSAPPQQPTVPAAVTRAPSGKAPRGRHLAPGERAVYDVDSRLPGEVQPPQLEVTPITKYASDPGLVLGRQIAVNRTYICYGLKLGAIRVLNINTALRSLLRGHNQRVTDMAFFAEDVHLLASASVDGRVFVWKIDEGSDEEDKPQITGRIVISIQIAGNGESYHPRVCWHSHKQEILLVGIGNCVLKIDTTKVGRGKEFSAEEPLRFSFDKLIDGVQLIGKHDGEVTDLSISQWMITRLASASKDGTVKIWDERKGLPLVTLRPHDGQPVNSVAFLTAPHRPDHIVLITAGPLNREVKIWVSAGEEGWLLPSDPELWHCTQTLDLRSSAEPQNEEAFFNQVVVLPRASLILLANAKKNAIYAVHVDYGPAPALTRMDYIADFTVAMPILSLTGTCDLFSDGEHVVQVYCVQTQAIQQYALDLSQCLPPPIDALGLGKDSGISRISDSQSSDGNSVLESSPGHAMDELPVGGASPTILYPTGSSDNAHSDVSEVIRMHELASSNSEIKPSAPPLSSADSDSTRSSFFPAPLTLDHSGGLSNLRSPPKGFEQGPVFSDRNVDQSVLDYAVDRRVDVISTTAANVPSIEENSGKNDFKVGPNDVSALPNPSVVTKLGSNTTHLITPFEILSGAISSSESCLVNQVLQGEDVKVQDVIVNNDVKNVEVEVKVVGESGAGQQEEFDAQREPQILPAENMDSARTPEPNMETAKECFPVTTATYSVEEACPVDDIVATEVLEQSTSAAEEEVQDGAKDVSEKVGESSATTATQSLMANKGKKQKMKQSQGSGPSSPSPSPFNSTDSSNEPGSSAGVPSLDFAFSQIVSMQETLNQLMAMQKELQKQMGVTVAVSITKEGKRAEGALGRSMEKAVKANSDALWARFQEENAKHEKIERDRVQQWTNLITNSMNKELPAMLERSLKKEISAIGPNLARTITPVVEKTISSAITDSFQRGIGDKAVSQLEKSVGSKLEATVARQIQAQFQTSGKQVLQDALRSSLESSVVPAFETSCKAMFEQVDAAFQKGMAEHTTAAQQQFESAYTPLALTLRDAINSASSITQNISSELVDGQRKLLALVAAGNTKALNPMAMQQSNGPLGNHPEMVEAPLDPMKELTRLISERKFGEAFTLALQRSDVAIVSWLCSQVDLQALLSTLPSPLNQGVLLSLLQQLACDISNETVRKLDWMTSVASAIIPGDPAISAHVRRIIDQVYNMVNLQRLLPTTTPMEANKIRLLIHVLNSILMSCK